jgi:type II secretory pathway pseudopilin PulG
MRAARREEGFMLIELLLAAALMVVILLATLGVFDAALRTHGRNTTQNDAQDTARTEIDRLARELRNAANPGQPTAFERATGTDLVFMMVDPSGPAGGGNANSLRRVRYCLDSSVPTNQKLWREVQTWTTAAPPALSASTFCPDFSWNGTPEVVASHVVNGSSQPVFAYDSTTLATITQLRAHLYVDYHPGTLPGPSQLKTSVAIRSTAQAPTAAMTATALGNRKVLLNAGASTDPGGQSLTYAWYDGTTRVGGAALFNYLAPTTGSHTFKVTVTNSAGLTASATQTVNVT